jgi:hypothetical protein
MMKMIDMPPEPRPAYEQVIEQKLIQCGLRVGGFTVKYEDELQSVEIVIDKQAGASRENIDCIREAAGYQIVTFRDGDMQKAYVEKAFEALKPKMLTEARAALEKRGLLDCFPERSSYASDKLFAEALERHCGMKPGTFFVQSQWGLLGQPKLSNRSKAEDDRMACLMSAITYVSAKGEKFEFGFIGNEAFPPNK